MPTLYDAAEFLALRGSDDRKEQGGSHVGGLSDRCELPLFDVRSPSEFARGHIPGAFNLPLFSDEERAAVGTAHARSGAEAAIHIGLEIAGPQLASKLAQARHLITHFLSRRGMPRSRRRARDIRLHCWRGGMRSASMAWLLETGGFTVHLLRGGYKAYRTHVRNAFLRPVSFRVLGGMTGAGKTDILHELAARGCQVLDLEALAQHRGSAFGGVGLGAQPSNETVENELHALWSQLDFSRPVWVEDENRQIGSVTLCEPFYEQIRTAPLLLIDLPQPFRVQRLSRLYAESRDDAALIAAFRCIESRLGSELCGRCILAVQEHRYTDAAALALTYYDKAYQYLLSHRSSPLLHRLALSSDDPSRAASLLLDLSSLCSR